MPRTESSSKYGPSVLLGGGGWLMVGGLHGLLRV